MVVRWSQWHKIIMNMFSLRFGLKHISFRSLFIGMTRSSDASSDRMMKKICQNMLLCGVMGLALSGCSIVVFEDGPDCPAAACPAATIPSLEQPAAAPSPDMAAEQPAISEATTSLPTSQLLMAPPLIDGYVTNFAYDSADLGPDAKGQLATIAAFLADKPAITLIVEGHCDERGSRDYNLALGDRRAAAVRDVLVANGMASARIRTVSYGKERPLAVGSTPAIWARNRRAVVRTLTE
jgi:peptidoglycan-associated lipoprotein